MKIVKKIFYSKFEGVIIMLENGNKYVCKNLYSIGDELQISQINSFCVRVW